MAEDRPGYSFSPGPPPEASRYMANRGLQPGFNWRDVEPEEHAVAFSVAKMMDLDLLRDTHDALREALDQGLPFAEFQRRLRPRLEARGWWGVRQVTDPLTGELIEAELGSPRRLRLIYETNLRSARAAGQWDRIQRTRAALPYLEYRLGPSERHRPTHEAKNYLVLPVDDPFWQSWYPPNGWNCKCWVRQLTRRQAEARGISQSPTVETRTWTNTRTGEVKQIPVGIDPGWERNPGALRQEAMERMLEDRLMAVPQAVRQVALRDIAGSWRVRRMATEAGAVGNVPIAILPDEIANDVPASTRVIQFSDRTRAHLFEHKADRRLDDLVHLADLERAGTVLLSQNPGQNPRLIFRLDHVAQPDAPDRYHRRPLVVVVTLRPGDSFLNTFYRTDDARWERIRARDSTTVLKGK